MPLQRVFIPGLSVLLFFAGGSAAVSSIVIFNSEKFKVEDAYASSYSQAGGKNDGAACRVYKDNQYTGMLVGSRHNHLNPRELQGFEKFFKQEASVYKAVFTEVPLEDGISGVEGMLNLALSGDQSISQFSLGSAYANLATIQCSTIAISDSKYIMPFSYA